MDIRETGAIYAIFARMVVPERTVRRRKRGCLVPLLPGPLKQHGDLKRQCYLFRLALLLFLQRSAKRNFKIKHEEVELLTSPPVPTRQLSVVLRDSWERLRLLLVCSALFSLQKGLAYAVCMPLYIYILPFIGVLEPSVSCEPLRFCNF